MEYPFFLSIFAPLLCGSMYTKTGIDALLYLPRQFILLHILSDILFGIPLLLFHCTSIPIDVPHHTRNSFVAFVFLRQPPSFRVPSMLPMSPPRTPDRMPYWSHNCLVNHSLYLQAHSSSDIGGCASTYRLHTSIITRTFMVCLMAILHDELIP